jgi:hypothetical protein
MFGPVHDATRTLRPPEPTKRGREPAGFEWPEDQP